MINPVELLNQSLTKQVIWTCTHSDEVVQISEKNTKSMVPFFEKVFFLLKFLYTHFNVL